MHENNYILAYNIQHFLKKGALSISTNVDLAAGGLNFIYQKNYSSTLISF